MSFHPHPRRSSHWLRLATGLVLLGHVSADLRSTGGDAETSRASASADPKAAELARLFPIAGRFSENPLAQAALKKAKALLAKPAPRHATEAELRAFFPRFTSAAQTAGEAQLLAWAYVTPASPLCGDPVVGEEILTRLELASRVIRDGSQLAFFAPNTDNHYNIFLHESFAFSYLALRTLAPGLMSPDAAARAEATIRAGLVFQAEAPAGHEHNGEYGVIPNIDARYAVQLALGAEILREPGLRAKADLIIANLSRHRLPHGAFNYIAGENECFSYHESVLRDLARYYFLTGHRPAAELLAATRDFYPLSLEPGGVAEYSSAPHWKAFWNGSGTTAGPMIVARFADDPVNRGIAHNQLALNPTLRDVDLLAAAACYEPDGKVAAQPDGAIFADANIGGFRGRFGRFSFLGDARDRRSNHPPIQSATTRRDGDFVGEHLGKATYVGALVTDGPTRLQAFNAALLRVNSRARMDFNRPAWQGSAYLSHASTDRVTLAPDGASAALSARYGLGSAGFGPSFRPIPGWEGAEAWLFVRDRLIGYVALSATQDHKAAELTGRIALGYGRAGAGLQPKALARLGPRLFGYGDLRVRVLDTNYAGLRIEEDAPYFREEAKLATEIVFHDAEGPVPVKRTTRRYFAVEIFPAWAEPAQPATVSLLPEGLVRIAIGPGTPALVFNASVAPSTKPLLAPAGHLLRSE